MAQRETGSAMTTQTKASLIEQLDQAREVEHLQDEHAADIRQWLREQPD